MRKIFIIVASLLLTSPAWGAILVMAPDGKVTTKATLLKAATDADTAGKTVIVTSALNATMSNISTSSTNGRWPADRTLRVEKGGVLNPTTKFVGLPLTKPEWFGTNTTPGTTDMTVAIRKAIEASGADHSNGGVIEFSDTTYAATQIVLQGARKYKGKKTIWKALPSANAGFVVMGEQPLLDVEIDGIQLLGNAANSGQHGLYMVALDNGTANTGGIWYSTFLNMQITDFPGNGMHFQAKDTESADVDVANQFLTFTNVRVFRAAGTTSRALYAVGQFGQVQFNNCEFDGQAGWVAGDGSLNVELILPSPPSSGSDEIYSIDFNTCTFQTSDTAISAVYAHSLNINGGHFEELAKSIFLFNSTATVDKSFFANSGNGGGDGYLVSPTANSSLTFTNNVYTGTTDKLIVAAQNRGIVSYGNIPKTPYVTPADYILFSTGLTPTLEVDSSGVLLANGQKAILIISGGNILKNIYSSLGEGELIFFKVLTDPLSIDNTGNIVFPTSYGSVMNLEVGDTAILAKNDLSGTWWLMAITQKPRYNVLPPIYANNAAALAGGLVAGDTYRTGGDPDPILVVH